MHFQQARQVAGFRLLHNILTVEFYGTEDCVDDLM